MPHELKVSVVHPETTMGRSDWRHSTFCSLLYLDVRGRTLEVHSMGILRQRGEGTSSSFTLLIRGFRRYLRRSAPGIVGTRPP